VETFNASIDDGHGGVTTQPITIAIAAPGTFAVTVSAPVSPIEGAEFGGQVASFTASNPTDTATAFTATIDWGDGAAPSLASISAGNAPGEFFVSGLTPHTYADEGDYAAKVTVSRVADGSTVAGSGTIAVRDRDILTARPAPQVDAEPNHAFSGTIATFTDADRLSLPSDFTATIDWGDGTTSTGVVSGGNGTFAVDGTHTYMTAGEDTVTVTLADDAPGAATATATSTANVGAVLALTLPGLVYEEGGHPLDPHIGDLTSSNPNDTAASFTAMIDYGDGTAPSPLRIVDPGGLGSFILATDLVNEHGYVDGGNYTATVTVTRTADGTTVTSSEPVTVHEDTLAPSPVQIDTAPNQMFSGTVATFVDGDGAALPSDFTATIDWGDGTTSSGTVSGTGATLAVSGTHTYMKAGEDTVTVTLADDAPGAATATATSTANVEPLTLSVALGGTAKEGSLLTATPTLSGNINGSVADVIYHWQRDGAAIGGATNSTYQLTEVDEGAHITVAASFTDALLGQTVTATSNPSGIVTDPPPVLTVSISGTAQENQTLQAIAVASSSDAIITYQWQQLNGTTWVNLPHATGQSYQVIEPNENLQLRVLARSSDPDSGNASATSAPTAAVIDVTPSLSVTISGTAQEGQLLSAGAIVTGDADGGRSTYQWQQLIGANWVDISGATQANYRVAEPVEGNQLRIRATFTDDTGQQVSATSDPTAPVVDPTPALSLTVSGTAQDGRTLTAHAHITSDADGGTTTYQWQRLVGATWTDIPGAQASTYPFTDPDEGFELRATAIFTDDTGQTAAAASAATAPVIDIAPTLSVSISGTTRDGQTLVATGIANDADASISFQWQQLIGGTWTDIAGATGSSYLIDETNEGRRLRVTAKSADPDGGGITVNSAATAPVTDPPPTLSVASSRFVPAGGSVTLPISVTGFDADDRVAVTVAGLPAFETITDAIDGRIFAGASVTLTAAEVNSGLTLHSSYAGLGQPVNVLTVTATNTTTRESSTSAAQTITVIDPPVAPPAVLGNGAADIAGKVSLLISYMASAFVPAGSGEPGASSIDQPAGLSGQTLSPPSVVQVHG
jgi:PKD repeat protein